MSLMSVIIIALVAFIAGLILGVLISRPKVIVYSHAITFKPSLNQKQKRGLGRCIQSSDDIVLRVAHIIQTLLAERLKRYWTQSDAAEKAEISETAYKDTESEKRVPRLSTIRNICKAFDMSAEELGLAHYLEYKYRVKRKRIPSKSRNK